MTKAGTIADQTRPQASLISTKHCVIRPHLPAGLGFRQGQERPLPGGICTLSRTVPFHGTRLHHLTISEIDLRQAQGHRRRAGRIRGVAPTVRCREKTVKSRKARHNCFLRSNLLDSRLRRGFHLIGVGSQSALSDSSNGLKRVAISSAERASVK